MVQILEESFWVNAFSTDVYQRYFSFIPKTQWVAEQIAEREWFVGVKNPNRDQVTYQYHLVIEPSYFMVTLRLYQKQPASLHLFGTVYHHLVHYLKQSKMDCLVHTDERSMWETLYRKNQLPLTATDSMSNDIVQLLRYIQNILGDIHLHPYDTWDGGTTLYLSTKCIQYQWKIRFCLDESEGKAKGYIEVDGTRLSNQADVQAYFLEEANCLLLLQKQETALLAFVQKINKHAYYDPQTQSLVLFQKHIPFLLQCTKHTNQEVYMFVLRIGKHHKKNRDIQVLVNDAKAYTEHYVQKERIRAIVEGRK